MKGPGQAHKPVMDFAVLLSKSPDFFTFSVSDIVFEREIWPSSGREKDFPTGAPTTAVSSLGDLHGDECSTSEGSVREVQVDESNTVAAAASFLRYQTIKEAKASMNSALSSSTNPPPFSCSLTGLVYVSVDELKHASRTPEFTTFDATCKTNKWDFAYILILGIDASWKNTVFAHCLLAHENEQLFLFTWRVAMPLLYGMKTMSAIRAVMSDGDPAAIVAVDNCISDRFIGDGDCKRKRCFFHTFCQTFNDFYASRVKRDGGVGRLVRSWARYIIFYEEEVADFKVKWERLIEWITNLEPFDLFTE